MESLGHHVNTFNYRTMYMHRTSLTSSVINKGVQRAARGKDLVIVLKGEILSKQTIATIRKSRPIVNWTIDEPFGKYFPENNVKARDEYDKFFIFDKHYVNEIKNAEYLPCAADPSVHKPIDPDIDKKYDVSFVGSHMPNREELLSQLTEFNLNIWGYRWTDSTLKNLVRGDPLWADKQCHIFNLSKINLNPHFLHSINGYNLRTFEIPASNSFQITNHYETASELFTDKELVTYEDVKDLKDKIRYYLQEPEQCKQIAEAGYKKVLEKHTIKHRMAEVLKQCKKIKK